MRMVVLSVLLGSVVLTGCGRDPVREDLMALNQHAAFVFVRNDLQTLPQASGATLEDQAAFVQELIAKQEAIKSEMDKFQPKTAEVKVIYDRLREVRGLGLEGMKGTYAGIVSQDIAMLDEASAKLDRSDALTAEVLAAFERLGAEHDYPMDLQ